MPGRILTDRMTSLMPNATDRDRLAQSIPLRRMGDPEEFGFPPARFHRASSHRARHWPHTMLATSTHDNKRSEDVRMRINVISELVPEWRLQLRKWHRMNLDRKTEVDGTPAPSRNDEYLLYQVLLGQEKGPRFGSFVAVYGVQNTIDMIDGALARSA